jgi:hypothetical protein
VATMIPAKVGTATVSSTWRSGTWVSSSHDPEALLDGFGPVPMIAPRTPAGDVGASESGRKRIAERSSGHRPTISLAVAIRERHTRPLRGLPRGGHVALRSKRLAKQELGPPDQSAPTEGK